ncbi:hypothetical protein R3P38DRAFT_3237519 [Favolaschia claudopus]|uniref:Uncharacterized protein n=1 Tax=Favolaschia claudopus TaxID=2862362 RepID=A0AAV9ZAG6_9AGAR
MLVTGGESGLDYEGKARRSLLGAQLDTYYNTCIIQDSSSSPSAIADLFHPNPVDPTHSAFSALTHLDFFMGNDSTLPDISLFPSLNHLCFGTWVPRDAALKLLETCPRLHWLLIVCLASFGSPQDPCEYD